MRVQSLVLTAQAVFLLQRGHTHKSTHRRTRPHMLLITLSTHRLPPASVATEQDPNAITAVELPTTESRLQTFHVIARQHANCLARVLRYDFLLVLYSHLRPSWNRCRVIGIQITRRRAYCVSSTKPEVHNVTQRCFCGGNIIGSKNNNYVSYIRTETCTYRVSCCPLTSQFEYMQERDEPSAGRVGPHWHFFKYGTHTMQTVVLHLPLLTKNRRVK